MPPRPPVSSGFGLPWWQVQQLTLFSPPHSSLFNLPIIAKCARAVFFAGLS